MPRPGGGMGGLVGGGAIFYRGAGVSVSSGRGESRVARGGVSLPLSLLVSPAAVAGNRCWGRPGNRRAASPGADSAPRPP